MPSRAPTPTIEPTRWERAADLFVSWREGETRAMDELVRLMTPVLWHVVRAYGLDHALAQDVVQTTWMTLVRRHDSITEPRAVPGWLTTCARREAWRVGKLQRRADPTEAEYLEPHLPAQESAEETASHVDESSRLWSRCASSTNDASACCASSRSRSAPTTRASPRTCRCPSGASDRPGSAAWANSAPSLRARGSRHLGG